MRHFALPHLRSLAAFASLFVALSGAPAVAQDPPRTAPPYLTVRMKPVEARFHGQQLSPEQLAYARVRIADGLLYNGAGELLDTEALGGDTIFVMEQDGALYVFPTVKGVLHHNAPVQDGPVAAAGELLVRQGRVHWLSDRSGHYHPAPFMIEQLLSELTRQGADLSHAEILRLWGEQSFPITSATRVKGRIAHLIENADEMRKLIDEELTQPALNPARVLGYLVQLVAWGDDREEIFRRVLEHPPVPRVSLGEYFDLNHQRLAGNRLFWSWAAAHLSSLPEKNLAAVLPKLKLAPHDWIVELGPPLERQMRRLLPRGDGSVARDLARLLATHGHRTEAVIEVLSRSAERRTYGPVRRIFLRAEMELKLWGYDCAETLTKPSP